MALDHIMHESIKKAVEEENQSETLADKIIAWVDALTSGNENIDDADSVNKRANLIYEATEIEEEDE